MGASTLTHYDIEMLWTCSVCRHATNRGLTDRYCCNCGHKKDAGDPERMPDDMSEAAALTGEDARRAGAGRDWVCKFCDSLQNQLNKCCGNCGATERGTKMAEAGVVSQLVSNEVAQRIGREVREDFEAAVRETEARGLALDAIYDYETAPPSRAWSRYAVGVVAAVLLGALLWWLFVPRQISTHVSQVHWQHDTLIERYAVYAHEGWYPESGAFETVPLGLRHHHYEHVHVGSHSESYQERYACGETCSTSPSYTTCSSSGNGTARCTKHGGSKSCSTKYCSRTAYRTVQDYRDEPRYQMWFGWKSWGWAYNRTVQRSGSINPIWPTDTELTPARIGDGERERSAREASYKVTFRDDDGETYDIKPKTVTEFLQYPTGKSVQLKVNHAGSVEVLP